MKLILYISLLVMTVAGTFSCNSLYNNTSVCAGLSAKLVQLSFGTSCLHGLNAIAGNLPETGKPRIRKTYKLAASVNLHPDQESARRVSALEKRERLTEAENKVLHFRNHIILLTGFLVVLLILVFTLVQYLIKQKQIRLLVEERNRLLETEKKLIADRQEALVNQNIVIEQELLNKQLVLSFFRQVSVQNLEMKNFLSDLKANPYIVENKALHARIAKECEDYHHNTKISNGVLFSDDKLITLTGISKSDAEKLNKSEKTILFLMAIHVDNPEIAVLFNTSAESIRNRKSQLKKKIEHNNIHLSEQFKGFK